MEFTLTLVNTADGLPARVEEKAAAVIEAGGGRVTGSAASEPLLDLHFTHPTGQISLDHRADEWRIDYAIQPTAARAKKLLVSDMEMTLVQNEFLDDIAALTGIGDQVKAITARAMNGEIDFAGSLHARLELLAGQPDSVLEEAWKGMRLMPGARRLFATLKAEGVRTVIVSGGFTIFTARVREILGADRDTANRIGVGDGKLTGAPIPPILGRETKQTILEEEAAALGIPLSATMAVGDGANDLPMLLRAGLGVAYHAKPSVAAAARCRVTYSDLTALLAFAGISPAAWVGE